MEKIKIDNIIFFLRIISWYNFGFTFTFLWNILIEFYKGVTIYNISALYVFFLYKMYGFFGLVSISLFSGIMLLLILYKDHKETIDDSYELFTNAIMKNDLWNIVILLKILLTDNIIVSFVNEMFEKVQNYVYKNNYQNVINSLNDKCGEYINIAKSKILGISFIKKIYEPIRRFTNVVLVKKYTGKNQMEDNINFINAISGQNIKIPDGEKPEDFINTLNDLSNLLKDLENIKN